MEECLQTTASVCWFLIHWVIIAICFWQYIFSENCGLLLSWYFKTTCLLWLKEEKTVFLFLLVFRFYCLLHPQFQSREQSIRFCLQLDKMSRICVKEFLELNWLNVHDRYLQFIVSDIFKFYNNQCPDYFNEVFCPVDDNRVATCCYNKKLKLPFCKSKLGMQSLSDVGPSTWNKLSSNFKTATSLNCFKHNIKKYFLKKLGKTEADICSYT